MYRSESISDSDPHLSSICTTSNDPSIKFHACERKWKCDQGQFSSPPVGGVFKQLNNNFPKTTVWVDGTGCFHWENDEDYENLRGPKTFKRATFEGAKRWKGIEAERKKQESFSKRSGRVVFVNPWEMPNWKWVDYKKEMEKTIKKYRSQQKGKGRSMAEGAEEEEKVELPDVLVRPDSSLPHS